jgi:hypothetical protein
MNERIREVWIKAVREDSDPDNWDTQEQFIERFAKLIVRECMEWCDAHATIDGSAQQIRNSIKNYFGVEE